MHAREKFINRQVLDRMTIAFTHRTTAALDKVSHLRPSQRGLHSTRVHIQLARQQQAKMCCLPRPRRAAGRADDDRYNRDRAGLAHELNLDP